MKQLAWLLKWTLKAAIFFTLFAFALNNQQDATVNFFFGRQWQAAMVLVVLAAFAAGVMVGVLGMVPRWWTQRQTARSMKKKDQSPANSEAVDPRAMQASKPAELASESIIDGVAPRHGV
ncbi:MAG: LapA family protein [Hylemonella sp.]|nr:LapA family protein [Hylemonella sp.]